MNKKNIISTSDRTAHKLAVLAKEKENIRRELAVSAKKLAVTADEKESARIKLAVLAKEKENIRRELAVSAKKIAVTADEKESARIKLAVTAKNLKKSRKTLEKKVLERTEDIQKDKARDEALLASIGDGMIAVDKHGRIITMSVATEKMIGWKFDEIKGKNLDQVIPVVDEEGKIVPKEKRPIFFALTKGTTTTATAYFFTKKDGTHFPVAIAVAPIILDGKIIGAINSFRDITKEQEISEAKTEFVSLASHQLRTPLTAINWYTEMILNGDVGQVTPKQKKYLDKIYQGNQRMIELVNTLLNVSRIEMGTFKIEPEPTDIVALVQSVIDEQKPKIEKKKLLVTEYFAKDIPIFSTDPKLLRIVFDNLLSNSVDYTPAGGKIEFAISLDKEKREIQIEVIDNGYGIPKNQQDKIFTKLFRANNVRDKDTEGTGLGLYLVRSIVENFGGKIWFESEENKGTTFYVTLPLAGAKQKAGTKNIGIASS